MYKIYTKPFGVPNPHVRKLLLIMRLIPLIILAAIMQVSASTYAQRITLNEKNAPLEKVFKEIRKQSGYDFIFDRKLLLKASPVNITVNNAPLEDVLKSCFTDQPLTYELEEKTVVVKEREATIVEKIKRFFTNITVTGTVKDEDGKLLTGVTVTVKGTGKRAVTNMVGSFILPDVPKDAVLIFTTIGKEPVEVKVNGKTSVTVTLKTKIMQLGEVTVNTGYQILQRSDMVGAASYLNAKDLNLNGLNTLEQALQGKLAGVVVTNTSGLTGTRQKTRVRGTSTLSGTQEPIWVVDGIIQEDPLPFKTQVLNSLGSVTQDNFDYIKNFVGNSINWLNPNDIEDITVLKDASATAIYGVRAANGVIVITTKKGKAGPIAISYSTNISTTEKVTYDKLNMMNSKERVSVSREIYDRGLIASSVVNNNIGYAGALNDYLYNKTITSDQFNTRVAALESQNTNWFDILFRAPISTNHNLSVSGGSNNTSYYSSIGYNQSNGTAIGNDSKGYTANLRVNSQVSKKFTFGTRLSASNKTTNGFYQVDPYGYASTINRVLPAYNSDGSNYFYTGLRNYKYNVLNELANTGNSNKVQSANVAIDANYEIIPGLKVQSLYSYNAITTRGESYATEQSEYVAATLRFWDYGTVKSVDAAYKNSKLPVGGEFNQMVTTSNSWNWRNSLSYSKVLKQKHVFTVLFGQEFNSVRYTGFSSTNYGYLRDRGRSFAALPTTYTSANTVNPLLSVQPTITDNLTNTMGMYLTGSYSYDNRYVANISVRTDRSNRFGQFTNESFNPVYAGGLRWNIANEKWFDRTSWLSALSLRSSFGFQRNISTNVSPDLIVKVPTTPASSVVDAFTGDNLLTISSLPYGDLRWEKNLSVNLGLDFSLFQNKVQGSVEYYTKRGRDLITSLNIPIEYGVNSMLVNGGSMDNTGYEVTANFVPVRTKNFTWSVTANTSKNSNTITKVGTQLATWRTAVSGGLNKVGDPVSGFYAFKFTGVDATNGRPKIDLSYAAGADVAKDPTAYMQYVGKMDPDFTSGLGMNFRYKMLTLSSSFYLQLGGKKFLAPLYTLTSNLPTEYQNLSRNILDRWTPTNTSSNIPGLPDKSIPSVLLPNGTYVDLYDMYNNSTDRIVSASSLRCNNLSLSYALSPSLTQRLRCKSINAGFGVSNPFSINSSKFNGVDPEVATGGQPRTRSYTLNLAISL
ncbi:SusC/RagA family TonB-linked outer membrane protein [Mucilaginibacter paludis]|uniref:TonB-dependent receptor plug n=1 Tax=Mucilaginibacter paludis DSM 18603 TaxID=714943 RepID=H1Y335_9SPHI|nr:SusC/RagA family TonB-linked outer membrane protein [Mucilaginibacter paludis]EHQ28853.1 TonB-dependent receptor plug [Mucilaginibacter paludis DSM 18603]